MLRSDLASRRVAHLPPRARRRYEERGLEILARVISSLKSPEAKRRLAPAVRYRLQAAAID